MSGERNRSGTAEYPACRDGGEVFTHVSGTPLSPFVTFGDMLTRLFVENLPNVGFQDPEHEASETYEKPY